MKHLILLLALTTLFFINCKKKSNDPPANEVYMDGSQYSPSTLTISIGTTIKWTNKESATHTVTSDVAVFESGDMAKDQTFSYTFNTAGTFPYHCKHHSGMKGTITVQ